MKAWNFDPASRPEQPGNVILSMSPRQAELLLRLMNHNITIPQALHKSPQGPSQSVIEEIVDLMDEVYTVLNAAGVIHA